MAISLVGKALYSSVLNACYFGRIDCHVSPPVHTRLTVRTMTMRSEQCSWSSTTCSVSYLLTNKYHFLCPFVLRAMHCRHLEPSEAGKRVNELLMKLRFFYHCALSVIDLSLCLLIVINTGYSFLL